MKGKEVGKGMWLSIHYAFFMSACATSFKDQTLASCCLGSDYYCKHKNSWNLKTSMHAEIALLIHKLKHNIKVPRLTTEQTFIKLLEVTRMASKQFSWEFELPILQKTLVRINNNHGSTWWTLVVLLASLLELCNATSVIHHMELYTKQGNCK